jgi:protein gp37
MDAPFPFYFDPTFHRYRLEEPQLKKQPQNIFVCSIADLFGEWVHDEWIQEVFRACEKAPQHRYLFLTKNPKRYIEIYQNYDIRKNWWLGSTITDENTPYYYNDRINTFLSIEPIQSSFNTISKTPEPVDWAIVGSETGNRKGKVIPKREWIENIVKQCRELNIPVFLKNSLAPIWGEPLIQEYPW